MADSDKRVSARVPLKIPVQCLPAGSDVPAEQSLEIWTSDVNTSGTGFIWPISSKPQTCPVCLTVVKDPNCFKAQCPYRALRDVLMDSGWLQFRGLDNVPGWENEEKVLGKVMWFKMDEHGVNFQFGVQFSRQKPPIKTQAEEPVQVLYGDGQEVHELDLERWRTLLKAAQNQVVVIDEDAAETGQILDQLTDLGLAGRTLSGDLAGMANRFSDKPKAVFINPVFRGRVKMEILETVRKNWKDAKIMLIMDPAYKMEIFESAQFHIANYVFLKPLDFNRIQETLRNF